MSLSIGLSGLRATNESLGVISHNIANVSTAGFKSARAEFSAVYGGGQAGGVEVNNVSQDFGRDGDVVNTGRALDLAISGSGFFMTQHNGQMSYTRAGTFNRNADNFIVSSTGSRLQGYMANKKGELQQGVLGDLRIEGGSLPAKASEKLEFTANLKADAVAPAKAFDAQDATSYNFSQSSEVYDSLGSRHVVTQYFVKTDANKWDVNYLVDGAATGAVEKLEFNTDGTLNAGIGNITLNFAPAGAEAMTITLDPTKMTQYASDFSVSRNQSDGYTAGELAGVRFESNGDMYAVFTNGQDQLKGKVVMADFANPNGLRQGNDTTWQQSFASGAPMLGEPGTGTLGSLTAGAYEGSNVELTGELVNLMTAQRNYQANSKTISTADKMTQILFNSF